MSNGADFVDDIDADSTIKALKTLKREMQAIAPEKRDEFLHCLTAVCIMASQGHLGTEFTNGLLDMAKAAPCPFVIDFDAED